MRTSSTALWIIFSFLSLYITVVPSEWITQMQNKKLGNDCCLENNSETKGTDPVEYGYNHKCYISISLLYTIIIVILIKHSRTQGVHYDPCACITKRPPSNEGCANYLTDFTWTIHSISINDQIIGLVRLFESVKTTFLSCFNKDSTGY